MSQRHIVKQPIVLSWMLLAALRAAHELLVCASYVHMKEIHIMHVYTCMHERSCAKSTTEKKIGLEKKGQPKNVETIHQDT